MDYLFLYVPSLCICILYMYIVCIAQTTVGYINSKSVFNVDMLCSVKKIKIIKDNNLIYTINNKSIVWYSVWR